jgi:small GTP-binding protein
MAKKLMKKIVLLGDSAVGKTSLIRRFIHSEFSDSYISTIGTKVSKKELLLKFRGEDYEINLMIWDMLGREGYLSAQSRQIVGAQGVMIVGDITRPDTLHNIEKYWIPMMLRTIGTVKLPFVFLGNKSDIATEEQLSDALAYMEELETKYNMGMKEEIPKELNTWFLSSAKTGEKVEDSFRAMGYLMFFLDRAQDPFYDRIQQIVIKGLADVGERKTVIAVLDQIVFEFSEAFGNQEKAGQIIREEVARAGIDHNNPKKKGASMLIEYLIDALIQEEMPEAAVRELKQRWQAALNKVKE